MVVDFSKINLMEPPVLILKNASEKPLGVLGTAYNITADIKYNEASVLEFDLPASTDGVPTPYYDEVIGLRVIDLQDMGQFILVNPSEMDDGVRKTKHCKGYSLEYEFSFKNIYMSKATYNFWNPVTPDETVLGIILELMPSWSVGSIDENLIGKYRTFEVSNENLYNFIKGTLQQAYNCIFDFDTYTRQINVKDASSFVATNPVYISRGNLAKEISVEERTDGIITRLDVNGAEGVNIRDVNPSGTNDIINLDYFMNESNFSQELIDKYETWKESYANYRLQYYNLSVEYALQITRRTTEEAALYKLKNELTIIENEQSVMIKALSMKMPGVTKQTIKDINTRIKSKKNEISAQQSKIDAIDAEARQIHSQLEEINNTIAFRNYFTDEEYLMLNRYLKDDSISESSFVYNTTVSYSDDDVGETLTTETARITGAKIVETAHAENKVIYDIQGGKIVLADVTANIIRGAFEKNTSDHSFVMTAYLGSGSVDEATYKSACLSATGTYSSCSDTSHTLTVNISDGYLYFTYNTSEYEKRAVAWDLYDYGADILAKISQPSFQFNITSANFLCLDDFISFKNELKHGEKIYIELDEDKVLQPIVIGASISYEDPTGLTLEFGDTFTSGDSSFRLADLLEQSISMGKNLDYSKYTYSSFVDSGANTKVKQFMTSALDVARNAIISSQNQEITWDGSGIRIRQWDTDTNQYSDNQIWINNNSIMLTSDNWDSAEMAIGNFKDDNLGDAWGVVAPNIVGTLIAGSNLVIESSKKDGGVAVFKMDSDGCVLHNADFSITTNWSEDKKTQILLNAEKGIAIGKYPLLNNQGNLNTDNAKFWVDTNGNVHIKGTLEGADGTFSGRIEATEGYIGNGSNGWQIGPTYIYNGQKDSYNDDDAAGIYIGTDGIALGNGSSLVKLEKVNGLSSNNVRITGGTVSAGTISGTLSTANIPELSAEMIKSGTIDASKINVTNIDADNINTGTLNASDVTITNLDASKITTGTLSANYIKGGTLDASQVNVINIQGNQFDFNSGVIHTGVKLGDSSSMISMSAGGFSHSGGASMYLSGEGGLAGTDATVTADRISIGSSSPRIYITRSGNDPHGELNGTWRGTLTSTSDRNKKNSITKLAGKYEVLFDNLTPVSFKFNDGTSDRTHIGFIAQDVRDATLYAGLTTKDFAAYVMSMDTETGKVEHFLKYDEFIALNTWQIQKLKSQLCEMSSEMSDLLCEMSEMKKEIEALKAQIGG